jgi:hypothetical protein
MNLGEGFELEKTGRDGGAELAVTRNVGKHKRGRCVVSRKLRKLAEKYIDLQKLLN